MADRYGAYPEDWFRFSDIFGLTADLLPVVSNPNAIISSSSALKSLGKTPSIYNSSRHVVGLASWVSKITKPGAVDLWSNEPDYGICVQTRNVRAVDIDIDDPEFVSTIVEVIGGVLNWIGLPIRTRANSAKCLLAFKVPGKFGKRKIMFPHGAVEFLANGQQFVASGTHPSGVRYEWDFEGHIDFPELTEDEYERVYEAVASLPGAEGSGSRTRDRLSGEDLDLSDDRADFIKRSKAFLGTGKDGQLFINCPWSSEHTGDSGKTETAYFPRGTRSYQAGHYKCFHAHCDGRADYEFDKALGYENDGFVPIADAPGIAGTRTKKTPETGENRFKVISSAEFLSRPPPEWIIDGVLPRAQLAAIYGESGSGKTFFALDLAMSCALGREWNGIAARPSRVVYLVAEGVGGFRTRLRALMQDWKIETSPIKIIEVAPNLMLGDEALAVGKAIREAGGADLVFIDTLAQVTPGADENSGEDMGRALGHCAGVGTAAGGMVVLIHHTGKDVSRGLRGWSGIKGALDASLFVKRDGERREVWLDKLKDGEDGIGWGFGLKTVELGFDGDTTSCVVEFSGALSGSTKPGGSPGRTDTPRLRGWKLNVLATWEDMRHEWVKQNELIAACLERTAGVAGRGVRARRDIAMAILDLINMRALITNAEGEVTFSPAFRR